MAAFDRDHAMHLFWDLDTAPPAPPFTNLFDRIKKSIRLYDPKKFIHRLVVCGDFSELGGVDLFTSSFFGGRNDLPEDRFKFFHYLKRMLYCSTACKDGDYVRYPDKLDLSYDVLKQDLLQYTTENEFPYHIMLITSDAAFVDPTIVRLMDMGFILHVACMPDAHSSLEKVGNVLWNWPETMKSSKFAFSHLRY